MAQLVNLTEKLAQQEDLLPEEASAAALGLTRADVPDGEKEAFLTALAAKGETAEEVAAFAETFRGLARDPEVAAWAPAAIDVCGTGGDKMGTFNISTTVMFVVAAGGVPVLKHGNRSITSQCGSADLLGALGVPMEGDAALFQRSLRELNFTFFFAPAFHPAFKAIAPVRQALARRGQRTIFNILGPLINPGRPAHQLLGVFAEPWMPVMAAALDAMKLANGYIAHCRLADGRGMDELSCAGSNQVLGFGRSRNRREEWTPARLDLATAELEELTGGDLARNLELFHQVIGGGGPPGLVDSILLNAGAAFYTVGKVATIGEGVALGRDLLRGGAVQALVAHTNEFYRL